VGGGDNFNHWYLLQEANQMSIFKQQVEQIEPLKIHITVHVNFCVARFPAVDMAEVAGW
jgi:hypothetical protein